MPRTVLAEKLQDAMSVVREANTRQVPAGLTLKKPCRCPMNVLCIPGE